VTRVPFEHGKCKLIPLLSQSLSGPVGIARLGFLVETYVLRWLLPASRLHDSEAGPIPSYLRAETLQMTSAPRSPCRLHA
jgi:hypothetical protein